MATQKVPFGNSIKNITVPRSNAYIKIAKENGSRLLPSRSIWALQILYQASFRFSPSLCLKFRISFSGDNGEDKGLAITTSKQTNTQANKKQANKKRQIEREREDRERGRIKWQGWSGGEENERQMANNVMRGIRVCDGYLVCLDLT